MKDPESGAEWQLVVDLAESYLRVDSARQYGLISGGPGVNVARCQDLLQRGKALGWVPRTGAVRARLREAAFDGEGADGC